MKTRLLILTAGFGEGHNAAARALAKAATALQGPEAAQVADVFARAGPRRNALARRAYLGLIDRAPRVWLAFYRWLDRSPRAPALLRALGPERRALARTIAECRPALLCSTYPVYGYLGNAAAGGPGQVAVVTDSISVNSLWWRAPAEAWFVPNPDSADVLRAAGVPAAAVHDTGFPVDPAFAVPPAEPRPEPGAGGRPRVLYIVNSGRPAAAESARRLLARPEWDVTCTVGRNEALRRELLALAARRPAGAGRARVLGWTDEIPTLLQTHHVVVSKAGGATTQEALAAGCPMIVNQVVPGQEEGNYELLRRHGIGARAETPAALEETLLRAFADEAAQWRRWVRALAPLSRPRAATEIARALLERAERAEEPVPLPLRRTAEQLREEALGR